MEVGIVGAGAVGSSCLLSLMMRRMTKVCTHGRDKKVAMRQLDLRT